MLVSPAESHPLLRALGDYSSETEVRGVDFLIATSRGLYGIQRKAVPDLVASLRDGRLARELGQIAGSDLVRAVLLVEGHYLDGWESRAQLDGILLSIQLEHGIAVMQTDTVAETAEVLRRMESWLGKSTHSSLTVRPKSRALWGTSKSPDWRKHVWQTFDGVSAGRAEMLDVAFDGVLPLAWTCDWDVVKIKGVGPVTVKKLREALNGTQ